MHATHPTDRLHGLDAIRGLALLLGVLLHTTMSFLPGPQIWVVADASRSTTLSITFFVIHMMRMTVFFLIAGFFGRMICHRVGWRAFAIDRLKRIAVPLVVAWPIVFGAILVVIAAGDGWKKPPTLPALSAANFPLTHLWFLYVLLILYLAALTLRGIVARLDTLAQFRRVIDATTRVILGPWAAFVLAVPVATALYRHPYWAMWFGIPTPDASLYPNTAALTTYGLGLALGWLVHRQSAIILPRWTRQWVLHLVVAVAATGICLAMAGVVPLLMPVPQSSRKLWYAATYAVALWSWTFAMLGMGLRFLGAFSPWRRYLADASYWIYLAHLPLVMALQMVVAPWVLPWQVKLPVILAVVMTLLLLTYHYLVRPTFIGATLNGRRHPRATSSHHQHLGATVMRMLTLALVLPAALAAQPPRPPAAIPLDTVLARHAAAVGPAHTITARRTTMRITGMAPFPLPIKVEAMRPNLIRKEVNIQGSIQITGYDGADAWRIDPFVAGGAKPMDVPAAELSDLMEETDFDGPLFNTKAKGHRIAYLGPAIVSIGARKVPVHSVKLTLKTGPESVVHLDATTYLEVKRVQTRPVAGRDNTMEITSSDYRAVGGLQVPHLIEIMPEGVAQPIRLVFERVELNVPLERRQFVRGTAKR